VVLVRSDDKRIGLTVDGLIGQRELVTRPLPPTISQSQPVTGGAVLSDGQIALIVDCDALAVHIKNNGRPPSETGVDIDTSSLYRHAAGRAA
jgi:chemotaxis protein histidine kinase CheA